MQVKMLKLLFIGLTFVSALAAPHEPTSSEKSTDDNHHHIQSLLIRPSPINPDIPADPKPPERVIMDDNNTEHEKRSIYDDKPPGHDDKGVQEHRAESREDELHNNHKEDEQHSHENNYNDPSVAFHSHDEKIIDRDEEHSGHKDESNNSECHKDDSHEHDNHDNHDDHDNHDNHDRHDHKRETDVNESSKDLKPKPLIQQIGPDQPTIVYPIKSDETRSTSDSFETSHHIPNINEKERTFETSHHIPTYIEDERKKVVENENAGQKQ